MPNGQKVKKKTQEKISEAVDRAVEIAQGRVSNPSSVIGRYSRVSTSTSRILSIFVDELEHKKKDKVKIPFGRFDPDGSPKQIWDFALMLFIFWSVLSVPYYICFKIEVTGIWKIFEYITDVFFAIDIAINFFTGVYNSNSNVVNYEWKTIANTYLKGWFVIDIVSTLPFDLIYSSMSTESNDGSAMRSLKLLRAIRLVKLLRLVRIFKIVELLETAFEAIDIDPRVVSISTLILGQLFCAHLIACVWYGVSSPVDAYCTSEATLTCNAADEFTREEICGIKGPCVIPEEENTWVYSMGIGPLSGVSQINRYFLSLYMAYATMTTVGYGDVVAVNDVERGVAILMMIVSVTVYGYTIFIVCELLGPNVRENVRQEKMSEYDKLLDKFDTPIELKNRVKIAMQRNLSLREDMLESEKLFEFLPPRVRTSVTNGLYRHWPRQITLFKGFDPVLRECIFNLLHVMVLNPSEKLFNQGELSTQLYILINGDILVTKFMDDDDDVDVETGDDNGGQEEMNKKKRKTFIVDLLENEGLPGVVAFVRGTLQVVTARTLDLTHVAYLNKEDVIDIAVRFPEFWKRIELECERQETHIRTSRDLHLKLRKEGEEKEEEEEEKEEEKVETVKEQNIRPSFFARFSMQFSKKKIVPTSEVEMTKITSHLQKLQEYKESASKKVCEEKEDEKQNQEDDISQLTKVSLTHKYDDVKKTLTILDPSMDFSVLFFELIRTRFLIFPKSPQKIMWDVVTASAIMFSLVVIPMDLAEITPPDDNTLSIVDRVVDAVFWIDVIVNFRVVCKKGSADSSKYSTDWKTIARRYLRTWFVIDVMSSLPFEDMLIGNRSIKLVRTLRLLRMMRMMRTAKLQRLLGQRLAEMGLTHMLIGVMKQAIVVFLVLHLLCCAWYKNGKAESESEPSTGWLTDYCPNVVPNENGTFTCLNDTSEFASTRYVSSLYWAFATCMGVGYGDIHVSKFPLATNEVIIAVVAMSIGAILFSIFISSMVTYIRQSIKVPGKDERMRISDILRERHVPNSEIKLILKRHTRFLNTNDMDISERLIHLPAKLQNVLVLKWFAPIFSQNHILELMEQDFPGFYSLLIQQSTRHTFDAGDRLVSPGQTVGEIYFILSGHLIITESSSSSASEKAQDSKENEMTMKKKEAVFLGGHILRLDKEDKTTTTKSSDVMYTVHANVPTHLEVLIVSRDVVSFLEKFNDEMAQTFYERINRHTSNSHQENWIKMSDTTTVAVPDVLLKYMSRTNN